MPLFMKPYYALIFYERVLHGLTIANADSIQRKARSAAKTRGKFLTTKSE
jgi:hypothetical protein